MYLKETIDNIRLELGDIAQDVWDDDELTRAINKSVSLMSRLTPKRNILEFTLDRTITGESLVISDSTGTLAKLPIKEDSLSIPSKTLNTHYRVNWLTGVVTEIGSGLPDTTYTVSYTLDPTILDISTHLTDYIRIERVDYDDGNPVFQLYDKYMSFTSPNVSLTHNDPLRIIYLAKWTAPTQNAESNLPSHLNDVLIIGASGQALIFKAEEYSQASVTAVDSITTILAGLDSLSLSTPSLTIPTAPTITDLTAPTLYSFSKPSAPSLPSAPSAPSAPSISFTDTETALDAAITRFEAAVLEVDKMDTPLADAATALGKVAGEVSDGKDYLATGDDLINVATRGDKVGEIFGAYAGFQAALAHEYGREAEVDVALASAWEGRAARETTIGNSYLNEAIQRLTVIARTLDKYQFEVNSFGSEVNQYANEVSGTINKYRNEIEAEVAGISSSQAMVGKYEAEIREETLALDKYGKEVQSYQAQVAKFQAEIVSYTAQANAILQRASYVSAQVASYLDVAGRYLASGQSKINEMLVALGFKPEFHKGMSSAEQRA